MKNKQSGFGLLEAIIAAGMVGAVAMMYVTMQKNASQSQLLFKYSLARTEMRMSLLNYLQTQKSSCACSLKNKKFDPGTLPVDIPLTDFSIFADVTTCTNPLRSVMAQSMVVENAKVEDMKLTVMAGAGNSFTGEIRVAMDSTGSLSGDHKRGMAIPFDFTVQDSGSQKEIVACIPPASGAGDLLAQNGYTTLPNGLILQWGVVTVSPNGQTTVNFTIPYPNQVYSVTVTGTSDNGSNAKDNWPTLYNHPSQTTLNHFKVHNANDTPDAMSWMAIGR